MTSIEELTKEIGDFTEFLNNTIQSQDKKNKNNEEKENKNNEEKENNDMETDEWVKVVDMGTTVKSYEMQEYLETVRKVLDAKHVRCIECFKNINGITVHLLNVCGNVSRMAIKRLSQDVFTLKWLDDARDQGLLQR